MDCVDMIQAGPDPWNKLAYRVYENNKHTYAVAVVYVNEYAPHDAPENWAWQGYRLIKMQDGPARFAYWYKVPCNYDAEVKRYPKHLAKAGQQFLEDYKQCKVV